MRNLFLRVCVGLFLVALVTGSVVAYDFYRFLNGPLVAESGETVPLQVERGTSFGQIVLKLSEQGLVDRPLWYRIFGRVSGLDAEIKAGEYEITPGLTARGLLDKLASGAVVQYSLTIVEGWTFKQMMQAIHDHPVLVATLDGLSQPEIVAELGIDEGHPEGLFYPDTYSFPRGTTDKAFLQRAYQVMKERLAQEWEQRQEDLPIKTPYQALILASIVERETGVPEERGKVAGVFVRRLQRGMRLQTDPTVIYGMGDEYKGRIRTRHLRTDTPYNTYTRRGLPPTPIAMPSGAAIRAALNPEDGNELYFVSRGNGSHHFSATLEEHNRAVRKYILGKEE